MKKCIIRFFGLILSVGMLFSMPALVTAMGNDPEQIIQQVKTFAEEYPTSPNAQNFVKDVEKLFADTRFVDMHFLLASQKDPDTDTKERTSPLFTKHGFNPLFPHFFNGFIKLVVKSFEERGLGDWFLLDIMQATHIGW